MTLLFMDNGFRPVTCNDLCFTRQADQFGLYTFNDLCTISPWEVSPSYTSLKESIPS